MAREYWFARPLSCSAPGDPFIDFRFGGTGLFSDERLAAVCK